MRFILAPSACPLVLLLVALWSVPAPMVEAQDQTKALRQRADTVSKRRNKLVAAVLNQYDINYCVDRHGIVTQVNLTGEWLKVTRIDVVPITTKKDPNIDEVVGHEVFIYTDKETLHLQSYLKVR